jgi:hypothetical protein
MVNNQFELCINCLYDNIHITPDAFAGDKFKQNPVTGLSEVEGLRKASSVVEMPG